MTRVLAKYSPEMHFCTKKVMMEIIRLIHGSDRETAFVVEENSSRRKDGVYRTVSITHNGEIVASGCNQADMFTQIRNELGVLLQKQRHREK